MARRKVASKRVVQMPKGGKVKPKRARKIRVQKGSTVTIHTPKKGQGGKNMRPKRRAPAKKKTVKKKVAKKKVAKRPVARRKVAKKKVARRPAPRPAARRPAARGGAGRGAAPARKKPVYRSSGTAERVEISGQRIPVKVERSTLQITKQTGVRVTSRKVGPKKKVIRI